MRNEIYCVAERVRQLGLLEDTKMGDEFYPAHLSVVLIDAVFTPRSHYERHVVPVIRRYCRHFGIERTRPGRGRNLLPPTHRQETLEGLAGHYHDYGFDRMREDVFKARYKSPGTEIFKSDNVYHAAEELMKIGVNNLQDAASTHPDEIKKSLCSIKGIGERTAHMFLMYSGEENCVKGDVHIRAFVAKALGREKKDVGPGQAERIVIKAAEHLCVTPRSLDYAIWKYGSNFKEHLPAI